MKREISICSRIFFLCFSKKHDIINNITITSPKSAPLNLIIPREIEYQYRRMFEDRTIPVMAYNLYTILAEKLETILVRGVGNTRARDYYDAYILLSLYRENLERGELIHALREKAAERGSTAAIDDHVKIMNDIGGSLDIAKIWDGYKRRYSYAKGIALRDILSLIVWVFAET